MAHFYSSLYEQAPFRGGPAVMIPRAPNVNTRAQDYAEIFTVTIPATVTLAANDVIHLIPSTPAGFKVTRLAEIGADWDSGTTIVGNLGYLSGVQGAGIEVGSGLFVSARTGVIYTLTDTLILQQTAAVGPQAATLNLLPAGANDELVLVVTGNPAGAGTGAVATFLVEAIVP